MANQSADSLESEEGLIQGGKQKKKRKPIETNGLTYIIKQNKIQVTPKVAENFLDISLQTIGFDTGLDANKKLCISLKNESPTKTLSLQIDIVGFRNRLPFEFHLNSKETGTIELPLQEIPLTAGDQQTNSAVALRLQSSEITPYSILKIELKKRNNEVSAAVIDKFGQRVKKDWPAKLKLEAMLKQDLDIEKDILKSSFSGSFDRFGGILDKPSKTKTGFFSVEKSDKGHWWFVTPEGHYFWSFGITGVRPISENNADVTLIANRKHLYEQLPDHFEFSSAWKDSSIVSFYMTNVLKKYGTIEAWAIHTGKRLKTWGFNTLGNWSHPIMFGQQVPYTVEFNANPILEKHKISYSFADVFNQEWRNQTQQSLELVCLQNKENPYAIGYFVDNEKPWHTWHFFESPIESPIRERWQNFLQKKYRNLDALHTGWKTTQSWDEIKNQQKHPETQSTEYQQNFREFMLLYADEYFRFISSIIKQTDPNHLYLGCRFLRGHFDKDLVAIYAKYGQVLSINNYDLYPRKEQMEAWHNASGLPVLIGEFHFTLGSVRQIPPTYQTFPDSSITRLTVQYAQKWAEEPYSLGCHWYQWVDQPLLGRVIDGENQTVGVVDIVDKPYKNITSAAGYISENAAKWHAGLTAIK